MGVVVVANVDLDDVDATVELARAPVVCTDRHAEVIADVGRVVSREDERLSLLDTAAPDGTAVVVQRQLAAFGEPAAVVGELGPHLAWAVRERLRRPGDELLHAENVVDERGLAVLDVERPAAEAAALGDQHTLSSSLLRCLD